MSPLKLFLFISILWTTLAAPKLANSQTRLGFGAGGNLGSASYQNSDGMKYTSLKGSPGVSINAIFQSSFNKIKKSKENIGYTGFELKAGYRSGHFKDDATNILTTWSVNYLSIGGGVFHRLKGSGLVKGFYGMEISNDFLVSGVQSRGFEQYDLTKDLRPYNFAIGPSGGIDYTISDFSHCTLSLSYLRGLSNLEKDRNQVARFHFWQLSAIVFFSLEKRK